MGVQVHVRPKAGLGIVFNSEHRRERSSTREGTPAPCASSERHQPLIRAESEPTNISYQPELYKKLQSLWDQASVLIAACNSSVPPAHTDRDDNIDDDDDDDDDDDSDTDMEIRTRPARSELVAPSVVEAPIFKMLYNIPANARHFASTKRPLPLNEALHNREFVRWVASKEAGVILNYDQIRVNLARLSKEPILRQRSPNVFDFFQRVLQTYEEYLRAGAEFLSYDLYVNMIDSYYGSRGDVGLLARFPVATPQAFEAYITDSASAMSEHASITRTETWESLRLDWLRAETALLRIKNDKDLPRRYDQLQKLAKIFNGQRLQTTHTQRATRRTLALRREQRRRVIKEANASTFRHQIGQAGRHAHTDEQIDELRAQIEEDSQTFLDEGERLLGARLDGMKIEDYPDTFAKMLPQREDTDNHLQLFGISRKSSNAQE